MQKSSILVSHACTKSCLRGPPFTTACTVQSGPADTSALAFAPHQFGEGCVAVFGHVVTHLLVIAQLVGLVKITVLLLREKAVVNVAVTSHPQQQMAQRGPS